MIELRPHAEGAVLPVHAHAGSRRNEVCGIQNGRLKVCTSQAPEKGKANAALVKLLAKWLNVRRSQVAILAGETSPKKEFLVKDIVPAELARHIEANFPGQ